MLLWKNNQWHCGVTWPNIIVETWRFFPLILHQFTDCSGLLIKDGHAMLYIVDFICGTFHSLPRVPDEWWRVIKCDIRNDMYGIKHGCERKIIVYTTLKETDTSSYLIDISGQCWHKQVHRIFDVIWNTHTDTQTQFRSNISYTKAPTGCHMWEVLRHTEAKQGSHQQICLHSSTLCFLLIISSLFY